MTYRANWFWQIKVTTVTSCLTGSKAVVELPLYQAGVQPGIRERLIGMFIKNAISLKIYFSNSKIIAVSLPGMKRRLSIFMPLFHLPVFWFGYFDGFKTLSSMLYRTFPQFLQNRSEEVFSVPQSGQYHRPSGKGSTNESVCRFFACVPFFCAVNSGATFTSLRPTPARPRKFHDLISCAKVHFGSIYCPHRWQ